MTKQKKIQIAMIVCGLVLACAVILGLSGIFNGVGATYAHAEKYTAGGTEITGTVRKLEISWTEGKVNLVTGGSGLSVSETATKELSDDQQLRWWLDGDTLRIQYCKSGLRTNLFSFGLGKELTVTLPEGMTLEDVTVETASAEVAATDLRAENAEISSASGKVNLKLDGGTQKVEVSTASGNIQIAASSAEKIRAESASGAIDLRADRAVKAELHSVSGAVRAELGGFDELQIETVSGAVNAYLPKGQGFTADVSTVSGSFSCGFAAQTQGSRTIFGDGSAKVRCSTVSGSINLAPVEE